MHAYIYTKRKNNCENFLYTKNPETLQKLDNFRYVIIYKGNTPYVTRFFMKFLRLAFIYKNHDTLRYVTVLYTKTQTLRKNQDNLRSVFIYKNQDTLSYAIFH